MVAESFRELREEIRTLDAEGVTRRLLANEAARRELEAENAALLEQAERVKAYKPDGHASTYGLLRARLGWSDAECRQRTQTARLIAAHSEVGDALFETWVSVAAVALMARAFASRGAGDEIDDVVGSWLHEAGRAEHDELCRLVERWRAINDSEVRRRHGDAHESRSASFTIGEYGGTMVCKWGKADAARMLELWDRKYDELFKSDWESTKATYGDQASVELMPRTASQLTADAVTALLEGGVTGKPGSKTPRVVHNVHIDWRTFSDWMVEHGIFPERHVDPFDDPTPLITQLRCETGDGFVLERDQVMRRLLEGYVRFVVLDDEGVPIRWGRERRLFTGAARDAVMALSPRCTQSGCRVRAGRCQIDHIVDWQHGGETCTHNGDGRCSRHNLEKNQGFTVRRDRHGYWHTYRPDGKEIR